MERVRADACVCRSLENDQASASEWRSGDGDFFRLLRTQEAQHRDERYVEMQASADDVSRLGLGITPAPHNRWVGHRRKDRVEHRAERDFFPITGDLCLH